MQLVTRQIVNEQGQVELWLGDSSRRLTAEELNSLGSAVYEAQAKLARQRRIDGAKSLKELMSFSWSEEEQRYVAFDEDALGNYTIRVSQEELEALRLQILARRQSAPETGFVIGGSAP